MRIYLAFPGRGNAAIQDSQIWITHIHPTLRSMGHEVIRLDRDFTELLTDGLPREQLEVRRRALSDRILAQVREAHHRRPLDLFLSYFHTHTILPEVIGEIRGMGVLTVNFSCNNVHQFHTVRDLAPLCDYCMVPERAALEKFRAVGARPVHVQMGANPELFRPLGLPKRYGVSFIGAKYADRSVFIAALLRGGLPVQVWGAGWKRESVGDLLSGGRRAWTLGGLQRLARGAVNRLRTWQRDRLVDRVASPPLGDDAMVEVYNQSRIALNFSKALDDERPGVVHRHLRLRDFEVPMTGSFYMPEYSDELAEYYEIDKEIVTFRSVEELVEKARYYLPRDYERTRIADAGYKRAMREHTWTMRFTKLFRQLGLG
jgi:spore maturation protein CgeB